MPIQIGAPRDHGFEEPLGLLSDCHRRIERFLETLIAIARQRSGAALEARDRTELEAALRYFAEAAPRHTADEEQSLFPRLRESHDAEAERALETMARLEHDHRDAERRHIAVDALVRRWLNDNRLPAREVDELLAHLSTLQATYSTHIAVEDRELFPAAARVLTTEQIRKIGTEMAARRRIRSRESGSR